jgi:O-methyltransferase
MSLEEPYRTVYPYITASPTRQRNLVRLAETIEAEGIPGAVVECGVLDGGTAGLLAVTTAGSGRPVHLFDAWQGLPETTPEDGEGSKLWVGQAVGSPRRVAALMKELRIDPSRLRYHVGWFHETFPAADVPRVALLHVDCDFHDPVKLCLEHWYPRVSPGGFIQFDDYSAFVGCRKAVDAFVASHPETRLEVFGKFDEAYYLRKP